jgi:hypothetical protein
MDAREMARARLRNQHLVGPVDGVIAAKPAAVVARFGAMQAQEFAVARWSIGQRARGLDDAAVQRAFDEGTILRTHALRPTWHFVAATDLVWIQRLTGPRVHAFNAYYYRSHGLNADTANRTNEAITGALRGGNALTRSELAEALASAGLPASGNRLAYVVMWAELDGLIASGPLRGKQHTYALVSERASAQRQLDGDAALAEFTRRYFTSHGPATVKDFAWWSSLTQAQIRRGIGLLADELASIEVGGLRYWYGASDPTTMDGFNPTAHVLQAYDEYVIAYRESRSVMNVAGLALDLPNANALVHPITVDGQLAGLWQRETGPARITARVRPLQRWTVEQRREIEAAFARYAAFAATAVVVEVDRG